MTVHIVVCVKQIPDPSAPASLTGDFRLDRSGKVLLDEADTYGVELALQVREANPESRVTLISMGDATDVSGLRSALAMGADAAVIVADPALAGADSLTTAKVLAAVTKELGADLVLAATESSDGYTGTLPAQLAELLGLPSLTFAKAVRVDATTVTIDRQSDAGYDVVTSSLPALVTVTAGAVEPRYANFKGIMAAKSKPVDVKTLADLGLSDLAGSWGQAVVSVTDAPQRQSGTALVDDGSGAQALVDYFTSIKVL